MVSSDASPSIKLETARTFVPGWWLDAFESAAAPSPQSEIGVCDSRLLPRFTPPELSLLAVLLGEVQRQILESDSLEFVELDRGASQKQLSGVDLAAKERLARVFESLSQVRFPIRGEKGKTTCCPLFDEEIWIDGEDRKGATTLRLRPSAIAIELLTGYTDGHLDFIRRQIGGPIVSAVNKGRLPLVLWTPVWLELSLAEQLVYARMEAAMQNESAWLRLDGLVGASLDELTSGLKLNRKSQDQSSQLMERLRLVGRLGRRLTAHGVIQREPGSGFVAVDGNGSSDYPLLLWQATSERLKSRAEAEYFGMASAKVLKASLPSQLGRIVSVFVALAGRSEAEFARTIEGIWISIADIAGCAFILGPGVMAQAHVLFLEWIARSHAGSLLPLPESIRKNSVMSAISDVSASNASRKFRDFLSMVERSEELRLAARTDGAFSVACGDIGRELEELCRRKAQEYRSTAISENNRTAKNQLENGLNLAPSVPLKGLSVKPDSQKSSKQVSLAQNLRRLAQDELDKMIRQSPGAYADLKQKYIASLDEDTKSLVMDVQRRLGSKTFDRHLRIRLVHYMVEHPSSWNSISMSLPS